MLCSEDKKIIIRVAAKIIESKEPKDEVIDVLYGWRRIFLFESLLSRLEIIVVKKARI